MLLVLFIVVPGVMQQHFPSLNHLFTYISLPLISYHISEHELNSYSVQIFSKVEQRKEKSPSVTLSHLLFIKANIETHFTVRAWSFWWTQSRLIYLLAALNQGKPSYQGQSLFPEEQNRIFRLEGVFQPTVSKLIHPGHQQMGLNTFAYDNNILNIKSLDSSGRGKRRS